MHSGEEDTQQDAATVIIWYCVCVQYCTIFNQYLSVSLHIKRTHMRTHTRTNTHNFSLRKKQNRTIHSNPETLQ